MPSSRTYLLEANKSLQQKALRLDTVRQKEWLKQGVPQDGMMPAIGIVAPLIAGFKADLARWLVTVERRYLRYFEVEPLPVIKLDWGTVKGGLWRVVQGAFLAWLESFIYRRMRWDQEDGFQQDVYDLLALLGQHLPRFVNEGAKTIALRLGVNWDLVVDGAEAWMASHNIRLAGVISKQTTETLSLVLAKGISQGETQQQLMERIMRSPLLFGQVRAERIARTEGLTALRWGGLLQAERAGATHKTWRSAQDNRVRDWHWQADGQMVPIREPFQVPNRHGDIELMMVPGDYSLGAGPDNVVNCRCGVAYSRADWRGNVEHGKVS